MDFETRELAYIIVLVAVLIASLVKRIRARNESRAEAEATPLRKLMDLELIQRAAEAAKGLPEVRYGADGHYSQLEFVVYRLEFTCSLSKGVKRYLGDPYNMEYRVGGRLSGVDSRGQGFVLDTHAMTTEVGPQGKQFEPDEELESQLHYLAWCLRYAPDGVVQVRAEFRYHSPFRGLLKSLEVPTHP